MRLSDMEANYLKNEKENEISKIKSEILEEFSEETQSDIYACTNACNIDNNEDCVDIHNEKK